MFAWQSLTTEEKIPYTFQRPLEGEGLAFATDNDDWSDFDITYDADWSLDENVSRAFEVTGYRVSDLVWLDEPSVFREEIADGESKLTFDHFDAEANDGIKRALVETGAVEVGIAAEQSLPDDAGTGEFTNYNEWCQYNDADPYQANHVVTIVGWDDDYPASNFSGQAGAPDGNGAWLAKNSWGSAQMYAADTGYHSYWASLGAAAFRWRHRSRQERLRLFLGVLLRPIPWQFRLMARHARRGELRLQSPVRLTWAGQKRA